MVTPRQPNRLEVDGGHRNLLATIGLRAQPSWMADALCKEHPNVEFIPERETPSSVREPLAICGRCASMLECRNYAIADATLVGIWGGMDTAARRAARRARTAGAC